MNFALLYKRYLETQHVLLEQLLENSPLSLSLLQFLSLVVCTWLITLLSVYVEESDVIRYTAQATQVKP